MPEVRHLARAPIREAVFDVRVPRSGGATMEGLRRLAESFEGFMEPDTQFQLETGIRVQSGGRISRHDQAEPIGFRVASTDQTRVLQLRTNGFAYSRLQPYTSWDEIRADVAPFLEQYVAAVSSHEANRLALRYINHLRLPYPTPDLRAFVQGLPDLPDRWLGAVQSFLYRVTLSDDSGASVHVTHALVDDVEEDRIGVIFDIDAFHEGRFVIGDDKFWQTFEELRELKNRIFFNGITDRTVEMYA